MEPQNNNGFQLIVDELYWNDLPFGNWPFGMEYKDIFHQLKEVGEVFYRLDQYTTHLFIFDEDYKKGYKEAEGQKLVIIKSFADYMRLTHNFKPELRSSNKKLRKAFRKAKLIPMHDLLEICKQYLIIHPE